MISKKDLQEAIDEATADIISAVSKGFETVATKDDVQDLGSRIDRVEDRLDKVEDRLDKVEVELKDVKRSINDLKADTPTPQEFANHERRISKLETAVFPS